MLRGFPLTHKLPGARTIALTHQRDEQAALIPGDRARQQVDIPAQIMTLQTHTQEPAVQGQERIPLAITTASGHPCIHRPRRPHTTPMGIRRQEPGAHDRPQWTTARLGSGPKCRVPPWLGEPLLLARRRRAAARAQSTEKAAHRAPVEVPAAAPAPQPFEAPRPQPFCSLDCAQETSPPLLPALNKEPTSHSPAKPTE